MDTDDALVASVALDDRHFPGQDDKEIAVRIALAEQDFARFGATPLSGCGKSVDLALA